MDRVMSLAPRQSAKRHLLEQRNDTQHGDTQQNETHLNYTEVTDTRH
jgi:hypothetical protein